MLTLLRPAAATLLMLTVLTGVVYPLTVTAIAQTLFPVQANGSVHLEGNQAVGSELLGQSFSGPGLFWGRPSATAPCPCNSMAGSASNLGPTNPALAEAVRVRVARLRQADPANTAPIPVDLVTASASGLDPHISPAGARFQINRVANSSGLSAGTVRELVSQHTELPTFGFLGQPRVNVLRLNLALQRQLVQREAEGAARRKQPTAHRYE